MRKTPHIIGLEFVHDESIESILRSDIGSRIAKRLGFSRKTYYAYRQRYNKPFTVDDLPPCEGCRAKDDWCQYSKICNILWQQRYPAYVTIAKFKEMGGDINELEVI